MQQFAALPQRRASSLFPVALLALVLPVTADPVINEIFYHEDHGINPENVLTEWIELHNPTPAALDLSNWTLSRGVSYVFPPGTNLPANGYLVVAADTPAFNAAHPGIDNGTNVFGPWIGRLQNSGETIELEDAAGRRADREQYADEGDWAIRARGPLDNGHEGWTWVAAHDGGGSSLELINPTLSNNRGQNWASSAVAGGSPGAVNSVASGSGAPLILNVR
ncbi:MAG: lamin tail domain-containing protein, partial [Roseibacillus sp.]|nr:lamin tail domain-containing protein [Roseibacillus sp.]